MIYKILFELKLVLKKYRQTLIALIASGVTYLNDFRDKE